MLENLAHTVCKLSQLYTSSFLKDGNKNWQNIKENLILRKLYFISSKMYSVL